MSLIIRRTRSISKDVAVLKGTEAEKKRHFISHFLLLLQTPLG